MENYPSAEIVIKEITSGLKEKESFTKSFQKDLSKRLSNMKFAPFFEEVYDDIKPYWFKFGKNRKRKNDDKKKFFMWVNIKTDDEDYASMMQDVFITEAKVLREKGYVIEYEYDGSDFIGLKFCFTI
jgi:hypothetical protein